MSIDPSGVDVILTEEDKNTKKAKLDRAQSLIDTEKATLITDAYAELIRRTYKI